MRIGIDAHAAERDGTGNCTYMRGLLIGLSALKNTHQYYVYAINPEHPFYSRFKPLENFHIKQQKPSISMLRIPFALARLSFVDRIDVLHVQYVAPPISRGRLVVTIHDLAYIHIPDTFSRFERFRSKALVPLNARKAAKIICGSFYSMNDIVKFCGVDKAKIEVIPYDVPPSFKSLSIDLSNSADVLSQYGINKKFIFSLGRLNNRKNLDTLIKAYETLRSRRGIDIGLVIGGNKDYLSQRILDAAINSRYKDDIVVTGYIDEAHLPHFYHSAEVFVYLSMFEGFGLPPLEAMSCGCPVVASNITSLPEVIGDAGTLVDPHDVNSIIQAIYEPIVDTRLKAQMQQRGLERAKLFDWSTAAERTAKIYEEVYKSGG